MLFPLETDDPMKLEDENPAANGAAMLSKAVVVNFIFQNKRGKNQNQILIAMNISTISTQYPMIITLTTDDQSIAIQKN